MVIRSLATFLFLLWTASVHAGPITVVTEHYPPYNVDIKGEVFGICTQQVLDLFEEAGIELKREDIRLMPWSKAYTLVLDTQNMCIYSTTYDKERALHFRWVGPLLSTEIGLIALKDTPGLNSLDELGDARIGVVRNDVGHLYLLQQGVPEEQLEVASDIDATLRNLLSGRVQYFVYDFKAYGMSARRFEALDVNSLQPVLSLRKNTLFLACNPLTEPALLQRLHEARDRLGAWQADPP